MTQKKRQGEELETDITFIQTPPQPPPKFATGDDCGVSTTSVSSGVPRINRDQLTRRDYN
jgi:hypothetical protein